MFVAKKLLIIPSFSVSSVTPCCFIVRNAGEEKIRHVVPMPIQVLMPIRVPMPIHGHSSGAAGIRPGVYAG
jgi:hypothetical protein